MRKQKTVNKYETPNLAYIYMIYYNNLVFCPTFCNTRRKFQGTKVKFNWAFFSMTAEKYFGGKFGSRESPALMPIAAAGFPLQSLTRSAGYYLCTLFLHA